MNTKAQAFRILCNGQEVAQAHDCHITLSGDNPEREPWTDRQLAYLRKHYADMRAEDIAKRLRHTVGSVWRTASKLGLKKSPEFLAQWGHLVASTEGARANQFAKGQSPAI